MSYINLLTKTPFKLNFTICCGCFNKFNINCFDILCAKGTNMAAANPPTRFLAFPCICRKNWLEENFNSHFLGPCHMWKMYAHVWKGTLIIKANKLNPFEMGFQIYDKVLIRILLNQPLLEGFARVFYNVDGRVRRTLHVWQRMYKRKTTKNLIKRKYLACKISLRIASKYRTRFVHTSYE